MANRGENCRFSADSAVSGRCLSLPDFAHETKRFLAGRHFDIFQGGEIFFDFAFNRNGARSRVRQMQFYKRFSEPANISSSLDSGCRPDSGADFCVQFRFCPRRRLRADVDSRSDFRNIVRIHIQRGRQKDVPDGEGFQFFEKTASFFPVDSKTQAVLQKRNRRSFRNVVEGHSRGGGAEPSEKRARHAAFNGASPSRIAGSFRARVDNHRAEFFYGRRSENSF